MPFYVDYLLTDAERSALNEIGVDVAEMTFGTAVYHRHGIVFSEDDRETVLSTLGLLEDEDEGYADLETPQGEYLSDYRHIKLVDLPTATNPVVMFGNRSHRIDKNQFVAYQPDIRHGMVLRLYDYEKADYRHRPGVLFVNIFCSPVDAEHVDEQLLEGNYLMQPRGLGDEYIPINDDEGRQLAYFRGDVDGGTLWILFEPRQREPLFLDYILRATAQLINPEMGELCTLEEYRSIWGRERYIKLASLRLEEEMDDIGDRVEEAEGEVRDAQRSLTRAFRRVTAARQRREVLGSGDKNEMLREMSQRLTKEFDNIASSSDFEKVEFDRESLTVWTRPILLRHDGRIYEMGKYKILIRKDDIYITSESGVSANGNCHPHITDGGSCCFGNFDNDVSRLQAEMSFSGLLPFLMRYLEYGYNPPDCNIRIEEFQVPNHDENEEVKVVSSDDDATTGSAPRRRRSRSRDNSSRSQASA